MSSNIDFIADVLLYISLCFVCGLLMTSWFQTSKSFYRVLARLIVFNVLLLILFSLRHIYQI